jgi:hypothetical protein
MIELLDIPAWNPELDLRLNDQCMDNGKKKRSQILSHQTD